MDPIDVEKYQQKMFESPQGEMSLKCVRKKALETALDIRKFEIELYWKRAGYFWTFIAASFAGFALTLSSEIKPSYLRVDVAYVLCYFGIATSWVWYLVLRASKFWQENWEAHVDALEDEFQGRLYKNVKIIQRAKNKNDALACFCTPLPYSVSKLNILLGLFVFVFWLSALSYLSYLSGYAAPFNDSTTASTWLRIGGGIITLIFVVLSWNCCETKEAKFLVTESGEGFYDRFMDNEEA